MPQSVTAMNNRRVKKRVEFLDQFHPGSLRVLCLAKRESHWSPSVPLMPTAGVLKSPIQRPSKPAKTPCQTESPAVASGQTARPSYMFPVVDPCYLQTVVGDFCV